LYKVKTQLVFIN